jgi:hypothetical protein
MRCLQSAARPLDCSPVGPDGLRRRPRRAVGGDCSHRQAGSGSYEVTANEVSLGSFPAGETANLGNFFQSQAFQVKGAGVPKAYVYIPQEP